MKKTIVLLTFLVIIIFMQLMQIINSSPNTISTVSQVVTQKVRLIQWQNPPACYVWIGKSKQLWKNCLFWKAGGVITLTPKGVRSPEGSTSPTQEGHNQAQLTSSSTFVDDKQIYSKKTLIGDIIYHKNLGEDSVINWVFEYINLNSLNFNKKRDQAFIRLGTEGQLVEALTFGQSSSLSNQIKEELRLAGLQHLVSVSSYCFHLTIELLFFFTNTLPTHKKYLELLTLCGISYIVVLMGFPAVLQRTLVAMGIDLCSRRFFHRPILPLYRLLLSSIILLLIHPLTFFEVGFQFAVMASLGLQIFKQPQLKRVNILFFVPIFYRKKISKILWTSIAAQLLTWPLIFYYFGQFSLSSPLACLAVAWILPVILPLGVGYWAISQVHAGMADILGQFLVVLTRIFLEQLKLISNSSVVLYFQPDISLMALGYCLITFLIICAFIRRKRYVRQAFLHQLIH